MPEISRFFGITITMYHREHGLPHFHVFYGEHEATIEIESGRVRGSLPTRALALALEWNGLHRAELTNNWHRARALAPLLRIRPLE